MVTPDAIRHLPTPVMNFLAEVNGSAPFDAQYIMSIGADDVSDAAAAPGLVPAGTSELLLKQAIAVGGKAIGKLVAVRARRPACRLSARRYRTPTRSEAPTPG
jgi:hypothetical protein